MTGSHPAHVTLVMIGALALDVVNIEILIPNLAVASLLGNSVSWAPLQQHHRGYLRRATRLLRRRIERCAVVFHACDQTPRE